MKKDGLRTEEIETKEPEAAKAAPKKKEKTQLQVYAGPTIPKLVAHGTVYNNGLPDALVDEIAKCPAIANLIVEPERLSATRAASHVKDTPEYICCLMVAEHIAKKGE